MEASATSAIDCGIGELLAALSMNDSRYARQKVLKNAQISVFERVKNVPHQNGIRNVVFEFCNGHLRAWIDDEEFISASHPLTKPVAGWISLSLWNECIVHQIRILGSQPVVAAQELSPAKEKFRLDMAVDFYDDLGPDADSPANSESVKFSEGMYDEFFARLVECGVKRVSWNYHDLIDGDRHVIRDEKDIGDSFEMAVKMAHKHGLQIFGTIKPFETQYYARYDKAEPGFLMARKPEVWGEGENQVIQRIDIVKEDDGPCAFSVEEVSLYVSEDNKRYHPYTGSIQREETIEEYPVYEATGSGARKTDAKRRVRVMRLSGLRISEKYLVISVSSRERSFVNDLVNLVHLFGESGEEKKFTYGTASNTDDPFIAEGGLDSGILFDHCIGMPTGVYAGFDAVNEPFTLDANQGFLGFERNKKQYLEVLGSPSYPQAREWWLSWVRAILTAGADGVEIRRVSHVSPFAWREFGFETPVRDAFFKRTGVDIWKTDDFDKSLWRRVRGEGYTEFCRAAREITRDAGKILGLHIDSAMDMEPEEGASMEIHWDWRTWIEEGLSDYILLKHDWPGSRFSREVLTLARGKGVEVVLSMVLFNIAWKLPGSEQTLEQDIRAIRDFGFDGFQYYDSAALLRGIPERQTVVFKNPAQRQVLARHFKNED